MGSSEGSYIDLKYLGAMLIARLNLHQVTPEMDGPGARRQE